MLKPYSILVAEWDISLEIFMKKKIKRERVKKLEKLQKTINKNGNIYNKEDQE